MVTSVFIDDRDPSVTHSGSSKGFNDDLAYNYTLTWLGTAGTAKISFIGELFNAFQTPLPHPIKGSGIGVYGTNYADSPGKELPPECLYTIDAGTPVRLIVNRTATTTWGDLFFQSPELPKSSHVLTIQYADNHRIKDVLVLDYFIVNDGILPSDPSSSLTTPLLSSTTNTPSTTPNSPVLSPSYSMESSSSSPTSGATPASGVDTVSVQGKSESKLPIGPIIGGALGALTFICTVFLILYFRRRRQEGHSYKYIGAPLAEIGKISRFLPYLRWLIIPDSLAPGRRQINPYDISQPPQHGGRGKSFVDTRSGMMGMATTEATIVAGTVERTTAQRAPAASPTATAGGNSMMDPDNVGGMSPIHGNPPPSYR